MSNKCECGCGETKPSLWAIVFWLIILVIFIFMLTDEIKEAKGSCQLPVSCASGGAVTQEFCTQQLKGVWFPNSSCEEKR